MEYFQILRWLRLYLHSIGLLLVLRNSCTYQNLFYWAGNKASEIDENFSCTKKWFPLDKLYLSRKRKDNKTLINVSNLLIRAQGSKSFSNFLLPFDLNTKDIMDGSFRQITSLIVFNFKMYPLISMWNDQNAFKSTKCINLAFICVSLQKHHYFFLIL